MWEKKGPIALGKISGVRRVLMSLVMSALVVPILLMLLVVQRLQNCTAVLSDADALYGGAQRLVKQELAGVRNDILMDWLDDTLADMQADAAGQTLAGLNDTDYRGNLELQQKESLPHCTSHLRNISLQHLEHFLGFHYCSYY